ncbi:hypothetical protein V6N13_126841 [Hibiscus sabdariffa]
MYGHVKDACGSGVDKPIAPNLGDSIVVPEGGPSRENVSYTNLFGSWMLVEQCRRRLMQVDRSVKHMSNSQSRSHFAILENEGETTVAPMMVTDNLRLEQIGSKDGQS